MSYNGIIVSNFGGIRISSSIVLEYEYDAAGTKLRKVHNGTPTDYMGNVVYNNGDLSYLMFNEGIVKESSGNFVYQYHIKDHLGNTRVAFEEESGNVAVKQVSDYYPFGLQHMPVEPNDANKYLYNGKELQDDLLAEKSLGWYDYGARFYDPTLGRWQVLDNLAEAHHNWSPYNYALNNPIKFIDPDGNIPWNSIIKGRQYGERVGNNKFQPAPH